MYTQAYIAINHSVIDEKLLRKEYTLSRTHVDLFQIFFSFLLFKLNPL